MILTYDIFNNIQGVFYLGGLMLGCSLLVFLTEIVWLECVNMFGTNKDMSKENQQMAWDNAASLVNQDLGPKRYFLFKKSSSQ